MDAASANGVPPSPELSSDGFLDLSRRSLKAVPYWANDASDSEPAIRWQEVRVLDMSRNELSGLPPDFFDRLPNLESLNVMSNHLRLALMPTEKIQEAMSEGGKLRFLDLRYNQKLEKEHASAVVADLAASGAAGARVRLARLEEGCPAVVGGAAVAAAPDNVALPDAGADDGGSRRFAPKDSACDRDGTLLDCQLAPWSTPHLRKRLAQVFGEETNAEDVDREELMRRLLRRYAADAAAAGAVPASLAFPPCAGGWRRERRVLGTPVEASLLADIRAALDALEWPQGARERPKVQAERYFTLNKPDTRFTKADGGKAKLNAQKLQKHEVLWTLAEAALRSVDPEFCETNFTALAVTMNFRDSPHIDTENLGPFYGLALGDYAYRCADGEDDGAAVAADAEGEPRKRTNHAGYLAVEWSAKEVALVDTFQCFGKVDGRHPHWVTPYTGLRYSLIFYQTVGDVVPHGPAVFKPFVDE